MRKCSVEGCERKHKALGLCNLHYRRSKVIKTDKMPRVNNPPLKCTIEGCNKKYFGKGFCYLHYDRYRKYGDPLFLKQNQVHNKNPKCKIEGCTGKHEGLGYCHKHYRRFKKYGSPHILKQENHGMVNTPEFRIWSGIKTRCFNPEFLHYDRYGGRGITMCEEWRSSFIAFFKAVGERPSKIHQLDRIDNDGNYEPGNCRWVTPKENSQNRSSNAVTAEQVIEIRNRYAKGDITQKTLCREYGLKSVHSILSRKTWKNI